MHSILSFCEILRSLARAAFLFGLFNGLCSARRAGLAGPGRTTLAGPGRAGPQLLGRARPHLLGQTVPHLLGRPAFAGPGRTRWAVPHLLAESQSLGGAALAGLAPLAGSMQQVPNLSNV
uniref:Secreted protein n=1 Tax=Romanomermis culicivorax TaxID=13658 RepID=A0A915IC86_ROMCU